MDALEMLARLTVLGTQNLAHNLEFIPDDRLDWSPAAEARSALAIVHHAAGSLRRIQGALVGEAWREPEIPRPQTRLGAQALILARGEDYATALRAIPESDHTRTISLPWGARLLTAVAAMPVVDLLYHQGQIAYLQTLLGDTTDHYDVSAL